MSQFAFKKIALTAIFLLTCSYLINPTSAQEIQWQNSLERATELAAKNDKLVLLHFTADWCRPCKTLETFVYSSPIVQHALNQNVIPVKIDVDLHPNLVKEYAVSAVPVDIVLTPSGRVVTKRNSPSTIDEYARMVKNLDNVVAGTQNGNATLAQNLDELKERANPNLAALTQDNQFQVAAPSHQAPKVTYDGANLARGNSRVLQNPFFQKEPEKKNPGSRKNVTIINEFEPRKVASAQAEIRVPESNQIAQTQNQTAFPAQEQSRFQPEQPNTQRARFAQPTGKALAKLGQQTVQKNRFFTEDENNDVGTKNQAPTEIALQPIESSKAVAQVDGSNFALSGKCPVTLMTESKWVDGEKQWGCVHRGRTYLFASKLHLHEFQADPDKYSPLLAGYDPVVYHERGELIQGLEENGVFMGKLPNQRVILFASAESSARFIENPGDYIETVRQAMLSARGGGDRQVR